MASLAERVDGVGIGPTWQRDAAGRYVVPERSLIWHIVEWSPLYLLQPDGPHAGEPFRLTNEQFRFLLHWYAVDERGHWLYRRGALRRLKGHGKDPLVAFVTGVELIGPSRIVAWKDGQPRGEPNPAAWIQIAAVAKDQTRNTMTLFPGLFSRRAIDEHHIDIGKEIIYAHHGRRRVEALTTSWRSAEGPRPTLGIKNETQHWRDANDGHEMSRVMDRNLGKVGGRSLAVCNAHVPGEDSVAEEDWNAYQLIAAGKSRATGFLYDSLEAPADTDLANPDSLRRGLLAARGDSTWVDVDRLMEEIYDPRTPASESRRYYLNQIVAAEDAWCAPHEWDACAAPAKVVEPGEQITLGFDGSKTDDWTVLVACRVADSHLWPLGVWDPDDYGKEAPRELITAAVEEAFAIYDVVGYYADLHPWESYIDVWEQKYGSTLCVKASARHPIQWDMSGSQHDTTAMVQAFLDAIIERQLTHANHPIANQHVYNAKRWPNNYGITFRKEHQGSANKIDFAAAAALARKARQDYLALPPEKQRQRPSAGISLYIPEETGG